ncbi:TPA: hypothetical protein ACNJRQ_005150, partial [Escherichia coli]
QQFQKIAVTVQTIIEPEVRFNFLFFQEHIFLLCPQLRGHKKNRITQRLSGGLRPQFSSA